MAINYPPQQGIIVICDYRGLVPPEMDKLRPVVVLSSVAPRLALVVPLSTTAPMQVRPWHYRLVLTEPITSHFSSLECWAKCDMVAAVSFGRLNLPIAGKEHGKRIYKDMRVTAADLAAIKAAVWQAVSS